MSNPFQSLAPTPNGPARDYVPIVPNDATDLADVAVSLYVEGGGAVSFVSVKGNSRNVIVPDFGWIVCGVTRVLSTGTTATGIHACVVT